LGDLSTKKNAQTEIADEEQCHENQGADDRWSSEERCLSLFIFHAKLLPRRRQNAKFKWGSQITPGVPSRKRNAGWLPVR
jgi:hypothetical protein